MMAATTAGRELLVDLVSIPSPSGDEDEAAERLATFFEDAGRDVWIDEVGNVRAPGHDGVLLTSHIDTVPGEIPVEVKNGESVAPEGQRDGVAEQSSAARQMESGEGGEAAEVLWGRGSVDATGPLAAMAVAAVETGASFAGIVGEETDSRGARHLVETREAPAAVVNGEPSGADGITLGYRGIVMGTYATATDGMHSSRPEPNAIQRAVAWWTAVENEFKSDGPVFEQVTAKPVAFGGGPSADGLSVEATVDVQFRIPPGETVESVREAVESVDGGTESASGEVTWTDAIPSVMQSPRTDVARAFRAAIRAEGGEPRLLRKTGTSDMNLYVEAWDCPMATYGPGDSSLDHAPDERLDLDEFDQAVAVLTRVADTLTGGDQ